MTAKECIKERRSIRKFKADPVDHKLLSEIIETASYAPSWKHTQITRYIAVEGELKDKIAAECTTAYPKNGEIIAQAPLLIAVTFIKGRSGFERDGSFSTVKGASWQMFDAGAASQTFCLAAHDKGLGTVIMGLYDINKAEEILDIPEGQILMALIAVGYPAQEPAAPKRKPVEDLLTFR